ncbi:MAG: hypothetical protein ABIQ02_16745 [Saprospiraceae bacterium]
MSTDELKERLIERIRETDNPSVIDHLYKLLELELDISSESVYKLSSEEDSALQEAEDDIYQNKLLKEEEANERIKKWIF